MLILAFESSAKAASVALCRDNVLLGQYFQNSGLTHSRTLLPMAEHLLKNNELSSEEIALFAVAHGPGSFTGVRIGVSAVKGFAWALQKPTRGVSTLAAMAWHGQMAPEEHVICCAMDARRDQVYYGLFIMQDGIPSRLCEDQAQSIADVAKAVKAIGKPCYLVGDGAAICHQYFQTEHIAACLAPEAMRHQTAWGVAMEAYHMYSLGIPEGELNPVYLRLSQAEREYQERQKQTK